MAISLPEINLGQLRTNALYRVKFLRVLTLFTLLATISTYWMWNILGWSVIVQIIGIVFVVLFGESFVSSQGYYQYPKHNDNGPFIRNVPIWIPFLWIFSIQATFLAGLILGLSGFESCLVSGILAASFDFYFLEPYFSRRKGFWIWSSVNNGYFKFIPKELDRFTAPPGNYITWLIFPIIINYATVFLSLIV